MKNFISILIFLLITSLSITSSAQSDYDEPTFLPTRSPMSWEIQDMVANCTSLQKISTLPNGDVLFLISGLYESEPTKGSDEAILIYCNLFKKWEILASTPSIEYTITAAEINPDWTIEIVFEKEKESVKALYNLKEKRFIWNSKEDEKKICYAQSCPQVNFD